MVVAGLLGVSELKGAPSLIVQSPTSLYLLAEFKLALGDTNSGLELLNRALAGGESSAPRSGDGRRLQRRSSRFQSLN